MSEESAGRWVTGTSLGEGIAVVILLGMLAALAVSGTRGVQSRIRVLEAIGAASADKVQWMEHWAVTGLWPTPAPGRAFPVSVLAPPRRRRTRSSPTSKQGMRTSKTAAYRSDSPNRGP